MLKVGLTGNFYSKYEDVAEQFKKLDVPVFEADTMIKYLLNYSSKHVIEIKKIFGDNIYQSGLINFNRLENNKDWDKLFDVIKPDVIKAYEKWRINEWKSLYTIFKSSILFEQKFHQDMNFNLSVFVPRSIRRQNVIHDTFIPLIKVEDIMDNEMCELLKNNKADYTIHSYPNHHVDLNTQIIKIHKSLCEKSGRRLDVPNYKNIMS